MRSAAVGAPIGAEQLTFIYGDVANRRHVRFVNKMHRTFGNLVHHEAVIGQVVNSKVFGKIIWSGDFVVVGKNGKNNASGSWPV